MSLILSIETATHGVCSVALHQDSELVATIASHQVRSQSALLMPMISHVLTYVQRKVTDLSAVALSSGPGSYTGLRIGAATAKGLCYSADKPLISIDTLEVMVSTQRTDLPLKGTWCALIDARRERVYALVTDQEGDVLAPTQCCEASLATFEPWLTHGLVYFMGSGATAYQEILAQHSNSRIIAGIYPQAKVMGKLAFHKFQAGNFADLATFEPLYLAGVH